MGKDTHTHIMPGKVARFKAKEGWAKPAFLDEEKSSRQGGGFLSSPIQWVSSIIHFGSKPTQKGFDVGGFGGAHRSTFGGGNSSKLEGLKVGKLMSTTSESMKSQSLM